MNLNSKKKQESIKSFLRVKPIDSHDEPVLFYDDKKVNIARSQDQYTFDNIFGETVTNQQIFDVIGDPLIKHSLQGYNGCVLAYGQTSSGKTFTMKGQHQNMGLIPLTLQKLFKELEQSNILGEVKISYMQIYNENILDLLSASEVGLDIREDYKKNITIVGLNEEKVGNVQDAMKIFQYGQSRRKYACNNLNMASSRSHTIFRITVETVSQNFIKTTSFINMVDLAGSEGVSRTKAEGATKKQGENINRSILALSNVIRCMSQKHSYINFRDSKLTRILQSSLCSNSKSFVICTVNPTLINLQQTINTLKFGYDASQIKLTVQQNLNSIQRSATKSIKGSESFQEIGLLPQQRIDLQENKRLILQLREENARYQNNQRENHETIVNLQLENHNLMKKIQYLEKEKFLKEQKDLSFKNLNMGDKELYEKQIQSLKEDFSGLVDKYQALTEYNAKIEKNQRYLINRIAKYENQLSLLKETTEEVNPSKRKTPKKARQIPKRRQQQKDFCPLTIGSIVLLKTQIIDLTKTLFQANEEIAKLTEERADLSSQLAMALAQCENNNENYELKSQKDLHFKIKKLQKEIDDGRKREKKLAERIKGLGKKRLQEIEEYNEWVYKKSQEENGVKQFS